MRARQVRAGLAAALALTAGCTATIGDRESPAGERDAGARIAPDATAAVGSDAGGRDGGVLGGSDASTSACAPEDAPTLGPSPIRRLNTEQYRNTVLELLGTDELPATARARLEEMQDGREGGFRASATAPSAEVLRTYLSLAEDIAGEIVRAHLADWVDCDVAQTSCARTLIVAFGRRAFRRPLRTDTPNEVGAYVTQYEDNRAALGANGALELVLTSMLASPHFLYLAEPVTERRTGGLVEIDRYAFAARLAYFIWQGPPDEALLDAVARGVFADEATARTEIARMLADPRAVRGQQSFHTQWLQLDELEAIAVPDPIWDESLRRDMQQEATGFIDHVMGDDARLSTMLTASFTYGSARVASLYGSGAPAADGRIELDPAQRAGVLTMTGFLTQYGTVYPEVHRGLWVRSNLLCDAPPPPPPDIVPAGFAVRLSTQPCVGCHVRMDLIGFGFADYDLLGRFRPRDANTRAADPAPEVRSDDGVIGSDVVGPFSSARELAERLAGSPQVHACVAKQWFRFASGRTETPEDRCTIGTLQSRFFPSSDIRELTSNIALSAAFRSRAEQDLR